MIHLFSACLVCGEACWNVT